MASDNNNNGSSASSAATTSNHHHPMTTTMMYYDATTATGMISPLTLLKQKNMNQNGRGHNDDTEDSHPTLQQQQQNHHHPTTAEEEEHLSHNRLSATRHYNRLKISQTREKIKRYFDGSQLLSTNDDDDDAVVIGGGDAAELDGHNHHHRRLQDCIIPRFDIRELTLGNVLGTGGFGTVVEIKSIQIIVSQTRQPQATAVMQEKEEDEDDDVKRECDNNNNNMSHNHGTISTSKVIEECRSKRERPTKRASLGFLLSLRRDHNRRSYHEACGGLRKSNVFNGAATTTTTTTTTLSRDGSTMEDPLRMFDATQDDVDATHDDQRGFQPAAVNFSFLAWRDSAAGEEGNDAIVFQECNSLPNTLDTENNGTTATHSNLQKCTRGRSYYRGTAATKDGESSYAIKLISPSIVENDFKLFLQAAIDMARETYFLSALNHPNILKLRAVGQEDMFSPGFFLVLDRLQETLSDRIDKTWKKQCDHLENSIFTLHKSKKLESLWEERVRVMKDLAGALCYMHDLKIIYRDIKPDNIGFDRQGNVKLFDFGLAREIREEDVCTDGTYNLTPNTGSMRYIAPENANNWPYNYGADCYSFGILLWEVTALERPYADLTPKDIRDMVITWGERPKIKEGWSARVVSLMKSAWDNHYSKRPTMKEIELELELELRH